MARSSPTRRKVRIGLYVLLGLGMIAALVFALAPRPVPVDVEEVTRGRVTVVVEEAGRTRVIDRYVVSAPIAGSLARIRLSPGDPIEAEEIVAHLEAAESVLLDPRQKARARASVSSARAAQARARAEVSRAQAAAEHARSELERAESLARSGGMSDRDADRARFEARSAEETLASARFAARVADHEVSLARAALAREGAAESLDLRSPVRGVVLRVFEESAAVVRAGQPLLEIGDADRLEVVVDVLTTEAVRIAPGQPAELVRWGGAGSLEGRVRLVEPSAFTKLSALGVEEQRVRVVLEILDPPEARRGLADGYRVETKIQVAAAENAVRVPASALFRDARGWSVYVVRDGEAHTVPVTLGLQGSRLAQVEAGLEVGDRVIVHPGRAIRDGTLVEGRR